MQGSKLTDQLFNTLTALGLKQASGLRQLSQSEKSLLELSEARSGPMLKDAEAYIRGQNRSHNQPYQKIIFEIDPPNDSDIKCDICGGDEQCEPGCPNQDDEDTYDANN